LSIFPFLFCFFCVTFAPSASGISLMNLSSTDFELFAVPAQFAQGREQLDIRWKELQREAHPDKFAAQGPAAQRVAMQWSVRINEAYQRLKDPIRRAAYLCELNGAAINAENNTAMPADFLMQQMELREALEDAQSEENLEEISQQAAQILREQLSKAERLIDQEKDYAAAAQAVRALLFIQKFQSDIERRFELLGQ
jgi:molecular chaperone HscB